MNSETREQIDRLFLRATVRLAEQGLARVTRHNPRVGCLLVRDGTVIGRGAYLVDGGAHAEVLALESASGPASGSTAYVTIEPCCWKGRTRPCTSALTEAGVGRVVVAALDSHPNVNGGGLQKLRDAGIPCTLLPIKEAQDLNPGQWKRFRENRPFVRIKSAISLDGRTALESGESRWITGDRARRDVQAWRARSAAILTGLGTVLQDDPRLTVRDARFPDRCPMRVVLDTRARIGAGTRVLAEPGRCVLVCGNRAKRPDFVSPEDFWQQDKERIELGGVLNRLAQEGVNEVLVEAGPRLAGSFAEQGLWDEWIIYVAPGFMGASARPLLDIRVAEMEEMVRGRLGSVMALGEDLRIVMRPGHD